MLPQALIPMTYSRDGFPAHQKLSTHPCSSLPMTAQVDYTGFSTINAQRFGQKFVGKVANPHDILLWHKAPVRKAKVLRDSNVCFASFPFPRHHFSIKMLGAL